MPQYYLVPKSAIRAVPALGSIAQWLEAKLLAACFALLGAMSPERASRFAAAIFRRLGPLSGKAKSVRRNMRVVFPDYSDEQIETLVRDVFAQLGMATAELVKMRQIWDEREQRLQFERIGKKHKESPIEFLVFKNGCCTLAPKK